MTNDEASKVLDDMKIKIPIPKTAETQLKKNEALDKAIKSLEAQETAHFVGHENPNYSPFDDSPKVLLLCSECRNAVLSVFNYCPMCGRKLEGEINK